MIHRLLELELENFRLFRGKHSVPLDADVVLIFGSNATGKSSLVSALEFSVTGAVDDFKRFDKDYPRCLRHVYASPGEPLKTRLRFETEAGAADQVLELPRDLKRGVPASQFQIKQDQREYFTDRCCLPQGRLSRLLEEYQNPQAKGREIPLIRFLSDMLGRNLLDHLEQGLDVASSIVKVRKSSEELQDLEAHQKNLEQRIERCRVELEGVAEREAQNRSHLGELAEVLDLSESLEKGLDLTSDLQRIRDHLAAEEHERQRLGEARQVLERQWVQLTSLASILGTPPEAAYETGPLPTGLRGGLEPSASAPGEPGLVDVLRVIRDSLEGEDCPVCGRDYGELGKGHLRERLAAEIGRLETAGRGVRGSSKRVPVRGEPLTRGAVEGQRARKRAAGALEKLAAEAGVEAGDGLTDTSGMLQRVEDQLTWRQQNLPRQEAESPQRRGELLGRFSQALEERERILRDKERLSAEVETLLLSRDKARAALTRVDTMNKVARRVRKEALGLRLNLLRKVYSRPLNDLWCDLFERLVRDETFRPLLADPKSWWGKARTWTRARAEGVEADFEQLGAVLSSGNLNTAGLTLFLALNLIEEPKMSTLVLDDPVQNMDDLHLVQLASLLRTLVHDAGRQLVVAVHERSLFDFLCLELGPTHRDGSLIALEVARKADGRSSEIRATRHEWVPGKIAL